MLNSHECFLKVIKIISEHWILVRRKSIMQKVNIHSVYFIKLWKKSIEIDFFRDTMLEKILFIIFSLNILMKIPLEKIISKEAFAVQLYN